MGAKRCLSWDSYRRDIEDHVDDHPELAIAHVQHDIVSYYRQLHELGLDDALFNLTYDIATCEIKDYEWDYLDNAEYTIFSQAYNHPDYPIGIIQDLEYDTDWIGKHDARDFRDYDPADAIADHNERYDNGHTITFPSYALAVIWMEEITGQISDGAWESDRLDWQQWYHATIKVDTDIDYVGYAGPGMPRSLDFVDRLTEYSGSIGRMVFYARATGAVEYDEQNLRSDLGSLEDAL